MTPHLFDPRDEDGRLDPRDVLDAEELADYERAQRLRPRRSPAPVPDPPYTWEPTEVDRAAGRTA